MQSLPSSGFGSENPTVPTAASSEPHLLYKDFSLPVGATTPQPQVETLYRIPAAGRYLRAPSDRKGASMTLIIAAVCFVVAVVIYTLPDWAMFVRYSVPKAAATPKPLAYQGDLPPVLRKRAASVNADIRGNRWRAAFEGLQKLIRDMDDGTVTSSPPLSQWARTEMLVVLASREIPPTAFPEEFPHAVYTALAGEAQTSGLAIPFRAAAAYVTLQAAPGTSIPIKRAPAVLEALDWLRTTYPEQMDKSRDLLFIEAESHVSAFPTEYTAGDRSLDYHWRRAAHSIATLYEQYGKTDAAVQALDRKRWLAVRRYLDFTLLTWDVGRIGWLEEISLDGTVYSRKKIMENLNALYL